MNGFRHRGSLLYAFLSIAVVVLGAVALSGAGLSGPAAELRGRYRVVVGDRGEVLFYTSLPVSRGDQFIAQSNRLYTIRHVDASTARAVSVLWDLPDNDPQMVYVRGPVDSAGPPGEAAMPLGLVSRVVVIYHTHTDESYEPTDGRPSLPLNGGVLAVGDALRRALERVGYAVVHDRTTHAPHDSLAYVRSRRTASTNLRYSPYMLLDIHRDSGPAEAYITSVAGQPTSQMLIVVGRQNPLLRANLGVARRLKAAADAAYPGLVKGIFLARGHYNQDLDPGALLLEVGTEKVPRELAERSMALFAQVVARAFGAPGV